MECLLLAFPKTRFGTMGVGAVNNLSLLLINKSIKSSRFSLEGKRVLWQLCAGPLSSKQYVYKKVSKQWIFSVRKLNYVHHPDMFLLTGWGQHRDAIIDMMPTLSSVMAPDVVVMTTSGATFNDKFGVMISLGLHLTKMACKNDLSSYWLQFMGGELFIARRRMQKYLEINL